jgi:hypothetical protein
MPEFIPGLSAVPLPRLWRVKQHFSGGKIADIPAAIHSEFSKPEIVQALQSKKTSTRKPVAALGVGSRGIANLPQIVKCCVDELRALGWDVFIVPAMGSHGGAAARGQREVLDSLGITESAVGAPVKSEMDATEVGRVGVQNEIPVYLDALSMREADAIIPIARVKPHTSFRGPYESGLCKMIAIGLAKHIGCARLHREGFARFADLIPQAAKAILAAQKIPFGLAILENAREETALLEAVAHDKILAREPELLTQAKTMMPRLLLPEIDVLVVEKIGKDISGTGMDPNITGRSSIGPVEGYTGPKLTRIVALGLTDTTHGNATGIGIADLTTQELVNGIDREKTFANVLTSGNLGSGKIPVALPDEESAIKAALLCVPGKTPENVKLVRIPNTLHLETIAVSENLKAVAEKTPGCSVIGTFDKFQ